MNGTCPEEIIDFAQRLADVSGAVIRRHYRSTLGVEDKPDRSPVTEADREAEMTIRRLIACEFPDHGMFGEEHGGDRVDAEFVWVIDPIDGTKAFIGGIPVFGTLIALLHRGLPILGVLDQPVLRERWVGARGHVTTLNRAPAVSRPCGALDQAILCATSPEMFVGPELEAFARVSTRSRFTRYGTDCYAYGLLSSGFVDLVVEAHLAPYDYLAHVPIVEGAGGVITDWEGRALDLASAATRLVAAGDANLHRAVLELLRST